MAIRKPALILINIQQTLDHLHNTLGIDNGEKRDLRTERIPQAVKAIEPDSIPRDERDVPRIILRVDHSPIDPAVEIRDERVVDPSRRHAYGTEFLSPSIRSGRAGSVEVESWDFSLCVGTSLLAGKEAQSDSNANGTAADETDESAAGQGVAVDTPRDLQGLDVRAATAVDEYTSLPDSWATEVSTEVGNVVSGSEGWEETTIPRHSSSIGIDCDARIILPRVGEIGEIHEDQGAASTVHQRGRIREGKLE